MYEAINKTLINSREKSYNIFSNNHDKSKHNKNNFYFKYVHLEV